MCDSVKQGCSAQCRCFIISSENQVCLDLTGGFAVDTVNGLVARVGDFLCVLGKLDLWCEGGASCVLDCGKFVYTAESRVVTAGDQVGSQDRPVMSRLL